MKTIIISGVILGSLLTASAADTLKATSVVYNATNTVVQVERAMDDRTLFTGGFLFNGKLTTQEIVNKLSYKADGNITVSSNFGSSTPRTGQVGVLAQLRMDAYYKGGMIAFFIESARQALLED